MEYPHTDPGSVLHKPLHGGNTIESSSDESTNNLYGHSSMHEGEYINIRDSENSLHKVTNDVHIVTNNIIPEVGKEDLHAAVLPAHKGKLDIVEILLERDAKAKNPNAIGLTHKALVQQLKNKSVSDRKTNCESEKKSDEHRIEIVEPQILNHCRNGSTRNSRQDGIRTNNFPFEKVYTDSNTRKSNCPSHIEMARFNKKRVTIHLLSGWQSNSHGQHGKLIILPDSLEELLKIAGKL